MPLPELEVAEPWPSKYWSRLPALITQQPETHRWQGGVEAGESRPTSVTITRRQHEPILKLEVGLGFHGNPAGGLRARALATAENCAPCIFFPPWLGRLRYAQGHTKNKDAGSGGVQNHSEASQPLACPWGWWRADRSTSFPGQTEGSTRLSPAPPTSHNTACRQQTIHQQSTPRPTSSPSPLPWSRTGRGPVRQRCNASSHRPPATHLAALPCYVSSTAHRRTCGRVTWVGDAFKRPVSNGVRSIHEGRVGNSTMTRIPPEFYSYKTFS
jgi:hypothetical protein